MKKIISQAKRDVTAKRQAQVKLQAEKAKRAKAARIAREAEDVRDLAARSLISPSLTPTIIAPIGEVKLTRGNPLSALLATSDADMEPLKHGDYPIIISDALLGKASKETVSGIRCKFSLPFLPAVINPSLTLAIQTTTNRRSRPTLPRAKQGLSGPLRMARTTSASMITVTSINTTASALQQTVSMYSFSIQTARLSFSTR